MNNKVIVNGAFGRMGQPVCEAINQHDAFDLVAKLSRGDDLAKAIHSYKANIVIDLTSADSAFDNTNTIISNNAHPVIGTSGLLPEQIIDLQQQCRDKQLGGIIAPNFSIGMVLLMQYAAQTAKYFNQAEVIEYHHDDKLDSPSGTAIHTAQLIAQHRQSIPSTKKCHESIPGARGADYQAIPIHSIRLPGLLAHQATVFGSPGETITLRHDSLSRECFMPGVLLSCQKVTTLNELVYGLDKIL